MAPIDNYSLVTMNTHVKYERQIYSGSNPMSKVKVF